MEQNKILSPNHRMSDEGRQRIIRNLADKGIRCSSFDELLERIDTDEFREQMEKALGKKLTIDTRPRIDGYYRLKTMEEVNKEIGIVKNKGEHGELY